MSDARELDTTTRPMTSQPEVCLRELQEAMQQLDAAGLRLANALNAEGCTDSQSSDLQQRLVHCTQQLADSGDIVHVDTTQSLEEQLQKTLRLWHAYFHTRAQSLLQLIATTDQPQADGGGNTFDTTAEKGTRTHRVLCASQSVQQHNDTQTSSPHKKLDKAKSLPSTYDVPLDNILRLLSTPRSHPARTAVTNGWPRPITNNPNLMKQDVPLQSALPTNISELLKEPGFLSMPPPSWNQVNRGTHPQNMVSSGGLKQQVLSQLPQTSSGLMSQLPQTSTGPMSQLPQTSIGLTQPKLNSRQDATALMHPNLNSGRGATGITQPNLNSSLHAKQSINDDLVFVAKALVTIKDSLADNSIQQRQTSDESLLATVKDVADIWSNKDVSNQKLLTDRMDLPAWSSATGEDTSNTASTDSSTALTSAGSSQLASTSDALSSSDLLGVTADLLAPDLLGMDAWNNGCVGTEPWTSAVHYTRETDDSAFQHAEEAWAGSGRLKRHQPLAYKASDPGPVHAAQAWPCTNTDSPSTSADTGLKLHQSLEKSKSLEPSMLNRPKPRLERKLAVPPSPT